LLLTVTSNNNYLEDEGVSTLLTDLVNTAGSLHAVMKKSDHPYYIGFESHSTRSDGPTLTWVSRLISMNKSWSKLQNTNN